MNISVSFLQKQYLICYKLKVEAVLQKGYGDKFDHCRFIAAHREIGYELGEGNPDDAALSVKRRLKVSEIQ